MTENDVKDKILSKIADLVDRANSVELSYLASALVTVERIGKPDAIAEVYKNTMESIAKARSLSAEEKMEVSNG